MTPAAAKTFLESKSIKNTEASDDFESFALATIGEELYQTFIYGYTKKQWGCEPRELPASILKRLPIRFTYEDSFYNSRFQGMPIHGYTPIFANLLNHPRISVSLESQYSSEANRDFDHVFYTGPIDRYFNHKYGRLPYRSLRWDSICNGTGEHQGVAVMNYTEESVPYTRIAEHKHFAPWEHHSQSLAFIEYSFEAGLKDIPYYPKRLPASTLLFSKYLSCAKDETNVSFLGRLGTYRYLNMDKVIAESLSFAKKFLAQKYRRHENSPVFTSPLPATNREDPE
jgi:UDP-galactopyranose mutase